jgi:hypothetical protein
MTKPTPESFPAAPPELRQELAIQIGLLALEGHRNPTSRSITHAQADVPAEVIPDFVTERLPSTDSPALYAVRVTSRNYRKGPYARLAIARKEVSSDWRMTEWKVAYNIATSPPEYTAARTVRGRTYELPPYAEPVASDDPEVILADSIRRRREMRRVELRTTRPARDSSGPWPEDGLVVPEAEQLLEMIAALANTGNR